MAARLIRLTAQTTGEEMFVRPETIMAFGAGRGFPSSAWILLWGTSNNIYIRETCQELANLLEKEAR